MLRLPCSLLDSADEAIALASCTLRRPPAMILAILGAVTAIRCGSPRVEPNRRADNEAAAPTREATPSVDRLPRTQLSLRDRTNWRAVLKWPDECEESFR